MSNTPISVLAGNVQDRLEEPRGAGIFWDLSTEVYTAVAEGINDLLMLLGRPTQTVNVPFTIQPNTVWQTLPFGVMCITDIQGPSSPVWKVNLHDLDYVQSNWGADWECDVASSVVRWAPIGLTMFAVHPAVSTPQTVTITGVAYPTTNPWPYTGNETAPFHDEFFDAVEMYAAHYLRLKEGGNEFSEAMAMYKSYLQIAQRMTQIEDRRDPYIFSQSLGAPSGVATITER